MARNAISRNRFDRRDSGEGGYDDDRGREVGRERRRLRGRSLDGGEFFSSSAMAGVRGGRRRCSWGENPRRVPRGADFSSSVFTGRIIPRPPECSCRRSSGTAPDTPSRPTVASLTAGRWCRALESARSATCRDRDLRRTVRRHAHEGGREVVVPVPGRAGPAGDRMLTAVQGERRRRCSSLLHSFLRSDAEDRPTYLALTSSFIFDGNGTPIGPL